MLTNLGCMYLNGEGVSVDNNTARTWFELAVKQGNPAAEYFFWVMYLDGRGGEQHERLLFQKNFSGGTPMACDKSNNRG